MNLQSIVAVTAFLSIALFTACKNDSGANSNPALTGEPAGTEAAAPGAELAADPAAAPATPGAPPAEPPQNAAGVWHFTCPKGCEGGAGAGGAVACPKCNTMMTHNQAYHTPPAGATPAAGATTDGTTAPVQVDPNKKVEPPQNAAGVWHFTCTTGCAGGAGSAINCPTCGKKLEHNKGYHGK